jgi:hypothetical protein
MNIPSVSSLNKEKDKKLLSTNDIYKIVLNKCVEKIVYTNRHTDKSFIIFEVPKILIGYTSYNLKSCARYIMNELSKNGYIVQFIDPFYIYIDWGGSNMKNEVDKSKIALKTKEILKLFPDVKEVEYIYEDVYLKNQDKNKDRKKLR